MFSYYGSKSKLVDLYPPPMYDTIIEPFAGSARYSLKYWEKDIVLVDAYSVIIDVWKYLQSASAKDILGLPDMEYGQSVDDFDLSTNEKKFLGFLVNEASAQPKKTVQKFSSVQRNKKRIAQDIGKIKHWKIINGDYRCLANIHATWFIDPPYQVGGKWYVKSNVNYDVLSKWCKSRNGQSIVCENTNATWLPFRPMKKFSGAYSKTVEAIWSNKTTEYDYQQQELFSGIVL